VTPIPLVYVVVRTSKRFVDDVPYIFRAVITFPFLIARFLLASDVNDGEVVIRPQPSWCFVRRHYTSNLQLSFYFVSTQLHPPLFGLVWFGSVRLLQAHLAFGANYPSTTPGTIDDWCSKIVQGYCDVANSFGRSSIVVLSLYLSDISYQPCCD
jgi:hypothetical protein